MRGGFVPGLSALDTSAQILAWGAICGYAQQLFTRLVDQQANTVLDSVRGADKGTQAKRKRVARYRQERGGLPDRGVGAVPHQTLRHQVGRPSGGRHGSSTGTTASAATARAR